VPDFGIRLALSEFGKAVEGKRFRHPETGNMVLYTSLPMAEQHRIYEAWKAYRQGIADAPKQGTKVDDVTSLGVGDRIRVLGPTQTVDAVVTQTGASSAFVRRVDPKTGKPSGKTFNVTQDAVEAFEIQKLPEGKVPESEKKKPPPRPEPPPFKIDDRWDRLELDDVFEDDVVAYREGDKTYMGRVMRIDLPHEKAKKATGIWVARIDPKTGKRTDKKMHMFGPKSLKDSNVRLVPIEEHPQAWSGYADYGYPQGWGGYEDVYSGPMPKHKPKPLTPEEKAELEEKRKEQEEERKRREKARKKAVERMGETGEPLKAVKDAKEGDVIAFHWDGDVVHARVIEAKPDVFFTIDVDPKTGEVLEETRYDSWRSYDLDKHDVHEVDDEHKPDDPWKENVRKILKSLKRLPEDPKKFFRQDKEAELVDLSKIKPAKIRLKGVMSANNLMASAEEGKFQKRKPISLVDNGDGTYTVRDGNSTYTNARLSQWEQIPAVVRTAEEWDRIDKEEEERRKKQIERAKELAKHRPPGLTWTGLAEQYGLGQQQGLMFPSVHGGPAGGKWKPSKKPPKGLPAGFEGPPVGEVKELNKGDLFGWKATDDTWYVGRVVGRKGKSHATFEVLHPETGRPLEKRTRTLRDTLLEKMKVCHLSDYEFPKGMQKGPKKRPKEVKGPVISDAMGAEEGDWLGYDHKGRWYVAQVSKAYKDGLDVEVYHPETGERIRGRDSLLTDHDIHDKVIRLLKDFKPPKKKQAAVEEMRRVLAELRTAYRPRWQDVPGYKTLVDEDSEKGILPSQTESAPPDPGQDRLDAMWPVEAPRPREKERALPLPSDHDRLRDKRIGPTYYNKPRKVPYRTLSVPGEDYGHPTKFDYYFPTRRHENLAAETDDPYEEEPTDDQLEVEGAGPFPTQHQKNQGGTAKTYSRRRYMREREKKKREERKEYRTRGKRLPAEKLKRKYRRMYPHRYERRGIGVTTPAERSREWRREQGEEKEREERRRSASLEALADAVAILGLELDAANWPVNWNTHVKKTKPPEQLDQNYQSPGSVPRDDPSKQRGESLRAPDLPAKPQRGLKWEVEPPAPGGLDYPITDINNPTDGSGRVIPMSYYTELVNRTQAEPDPRQDRYLRNDNFEVKVAYTLPEILKRVDSKIKMRAQDYVPRLARTDTKNWIWHWKVGDHTVKVQAFKRGRAEKLPKLNLRISCSCPYWRWWGPAHWATRNDYQSGTAPGTATYPRVRDPAHWRPLCKHAYAVLQKSLDFFVRPEKSPLRKLGIRFSFDGEDAVEVEPVSDDSAVRVARTTVERELGRRVAARYLGRKET